MYEKRCALTEIHTHANRPSVGRKKLFPVRLTLPLTDETVKRLDAARGDGEDRLDVIRDGIERELKRREKAAKS